MEQALERVANLATCAGCGAARDRRAPACPACGRLAVPPHEEWGRGLKRYLVLRVLASKVGGMVNPTLQQLWERILQDAMMLEPATKRATPLPDLYVTAAQRYESWVSGGAIPPAPFVDPKDL